MVKMDKMGIKIVFSLLQKRASTLQIRKEGNDQESIHTSHQRHQRERNTNTK